MKDFKFLKGIEQDIELISQNEWNRRRDALAERMERYTNQQEIFEENEKRLQESELLNEYYRSELDSLRKKRNVSFINKLKNMFRKIVNIFKIFI